MLFKIFFNHSILSSTICVFIYLAYTNNSIENSAAMKPKENGNVRSTEMHVCKYNDFVRMLPVSSSLHSLDAKSSQVRFIFRLSLSNSVFSFFKFVVFFLFVMYQISIIFINPSNVYLQPISN